MAKGQKAIDRAIAQKKKAIAKIVAHKKAVASEKKKKRQLQSLTNRLHRMKMKKKN